MLLKDYEDYIERLCKSNKQVRHGATVAGGKRRSWIPMGTDESPVNNTKLASPYVQHQHFYGAGREHSQWIYSTELLFLVNVDIAKGNTEAEVQKARTEAHAIMLAFDAKILDDHDNGITCHLFDDVLEAEMEPVGPLNQNAVGWLYSFKFTVPREESNDEDWEGEE